MRADAQRNRELIVAAARDLFAEAGVDAPVDEIARRAGVGIGTFYRHFKTKEALVEAIFMDRARCLLETASAAVRAEDPGAGLFDVLSRMVTNQGRKKDLLAALSRHDLNFREAGASILDELWRAVGTLLSRAQAARSVRNDIDLAQLKAILNGACVSLDMVGGDHEQEQRIWSVFRDGLSVREPV